MEGRKVALSIVLALSGLGLFIAYFFYSIPGGVDERVFGGNPFYALFIIFWLFTLSGLIFALALIWLLVIMVKSRKSK